MATKQTEVSDVLPALAMAAIGNNMDEKLKELLLEMVEDQLEKRRKQKEKQKNLDLSRLREVEEQRKSKDLQKKRCSHRKQDGRTRLVGQFLSNRQLSLVCQFCNQEFFRPAFEGQLEIPQELMPSMDEIGG